MLALTYFLLPQLAAAAATGWSSTNAAAYFLDNAEAGASIVALKINTQDGSLSDPVRTSTGGKGLFGLTASATGGAAAAGGADTLFTQDSVVVSGNYLFTVNAGSNTLSLFSIDDKDPTHPKLIDSAPTLGEFPSAVAYSDFLETACVINGGKVAGIACFEVSSKGLKPAGGLRPLALNQTTPPVGPPGTVSDLVFNPSQSALIATVKGSPTAPGSIYAYPVEDSCEISTTPVVSKPDGLLLDFSINFLGHDSKAVVTDPAYGASIVDVSNKFEVTVKNKVTIPGQGATCWSAYSANSNTVYVFDGGVSNITTIDPDTGKISGVVAQGDDGKGSLDSAWYSNYLYVLKGAPQISVIDTTPSGGWGWSKKAAQTLDLSALGSRQGWQGLAVYSSPASSWWKN